MVAKTEIPAPGRVFGYVVEGLAMPVEEQKAAIDECRGRSPVKRWHLAWSGFTIDPDGHLADMPKRPIGRELLNSLRPRDVVLVATMGIAAPSVEAFEEILSALTATRSVIFPVDVLALGADLDREIKSTRQRDVFTIRRLQGRSNGHAPIGYRHVGPKGKRVLIPDTQERLTMRWIVEQRNAGHTWWGIARMLQKNRIMWARADRSQPHGFTWEHWDYRRVRRAYHRMLDIERAEREAADIQT